jgi:hypothetical protein
MENFYHAPEKTPCFNGGNNPVTGNGITIRKIVKVT